MRLLILCLLWVSKSYAFSWQSLWSTADQQGQKSLQEQRYQDAEQQFTNKDWQAVAAYRNKKFDKAADLLAKNKDELSLYNQANALAQLGKYEQAIKSYDDALKLNPNNDDAKFNRQLVAELLKKEPPKKSDKESNKNKKPQDSQDKNDDKDKNENKQQKNSDQKSTDEPSQAGKDHGKSNDEKQPKQANQDDKKAGNPPKETTKAEAKKNNNKTDNNNAQPTKVPSAAEREKQQAKEQWLRLVPDDPGGLLRQKFLRDYLQRQQ